MERLRYPEIFRQNGSFQRAISLEQDMGHTALLENFIPTWASAEVLVRYLRSALHKGGERASVLIGPYGKGKSYTLLLALSVLSDYSEQAEATIRQVAERLERVSPEAAQLVRRVRERKIRMLPVLINDRYFDVRQAFLASLQKALSAEDLADIMPENYFERALETIRRWKEQYAPTWRAYEAWLGDRSLRTADFENRLLAYETEALNLFRACHREILAGAEFNPLLESDVPSLYENTMRHVCQKKGYSGLFVVFDEFGKYLESTANRQEAHDFKMLQDLAEIAAHSGEPCLLFTCVSHKSISEYANRLSDSQRNSFRTIEGRFASIGFQSTMEGSFELIRGALEPREEQFQSFLNGCREQVAETAKACASLGCFRDCGEDMEELVKRCLPLHPLTARALIRLSELAAQNERTLFTFLSDPASPMTEFLQSHDGSFRLAGVDLVYPYFWETVRENTYDPELRERITYTESLAPLLEEDERKLVRAITLFNMMNDAALRPVREVLREGLQWSRERLDDVIRKLEKEHRIYVRRSDGVLCLMRHATETIRQEIEEEMALQKENVDLAEELARIQPPGYTIPRRYNDKYEMVRFFRNVFLTAEEFFREPSSAFLEKRGFADGYVVYLLEDGDSDRVREQLKSWKDPRILVLLPEPQEGLRSALEECAAIHAVMEKTEDPVEREELTYYLDDETALVRGALTKMYGDGCRYVTEEAKEKEGTCREPGHVVSEICEQVYSWTMRINHEMINRSMLTGTMRQVRRKIIEAVLNQENYLEAYRARTAEGAAMQAVLNGEHKEEKQRIGQVMERFFDTCAREPQPLSDLWQTLTAPPYGMRRGVLPILLAEKLRDRKNMVTLYSGTHEMPLRELADLPLDQHVETCRILVDPGSRKQQEYLEALRKKFTPEAETASVTELHEALTRRIRALPQAARANQRLFFARNEKENVRVARLQPFVAGIRQELLSFEAEPRACLLEKIPKQAELELGKDCAARIVTAVSALENYMLRMKQRGARLVRQCLGGSTEQSPQEVALAWVEGLTPEQRNRAYDSTVTAFLQQMEAADLYEEAEWVGRLAQALTGIAMEDWGDSQVNGFEKLVTQAISTVKRVKEAEPAGDTGTFIRMTMDGKTISQSLEDEELGGLGEVMFHSVCHLMEEYNESVSGEEKLRVLMKAILRLRGEG